VRKEKQILSRPSASQHIENFIINECCNNQSDRELTRSDWPYYAILLFRPFIRIIIAASYIRPCSARKVGSF